MEYAYGYTAECPYKRNAGIPQKYGDYGFHGGSPDSLLKAVWRQNEALIQGNQLTVSENEVLKDFFSFFVFLAFSPFSSHWETSQKRNANTIFRPFHRVSHLYFPPVIVPRALGKFCGISPPYIFNILFSLGNFTKKHIRILFFVHIIDFLFCIFHPVIVPRALSKFCGVFYTLIIYKSHCKEM